MYLGCTTVRYDTSSTYASSFSRPCIFLLTSFRYFAEKSVLGSIYHDGGMFFNNPSAIARQEGSKIWSCAASENILLSIGCGDAIFVPQDKNGLARVWNAFSYKLSPAKEEEVRELWGNDASNYFRLDPKLDFNMIELDDIELMLSMMPAVKASMAQDKQFQKAVQISAWHLIAASFFCDIKTYKLPHKSANRAKLGIYNRLGKDVCRMWERYPDLQFIVDGNIIPREVGKLPLDIAVDLSDKNRILNIQIESNGQRASISGFPKSLTTLLNERGEFFSPATSLGKRKRNRL